MAFSQSVDRSNAARIIATWTDYDEGDTPVGVQVPIGETDIYFHVDGTFGSGGAPCEVSIDNSTFITAVDAFGTAMSAANITAETNLPLGSHAPYIRPGVPTGTGCSLTATIIMIVKGR